MSVLIPGPPSIPPHTSLIEYHPDSLSARLSGPRSTASRFFHWPPPVMEPDSPSPNVRKREASSLSSGRVYLSPSTSPEPRPSKMTRQQSPVAEDVESEIHEIFKLYRANSEQILHLFKDDLINLFRTAKLKGSGGESPTSLLKDLIDRCMLQFEGLANSNVVQWEMTPEILDYITAVLGEPPIVREPPLVWLPPDFDKADTYCYQACMDDTQVFNFGYFKGEPIQATMEGSVECWGEDHFAGRGTMTIEVGSGRMRRIDIKVVVLGYVICTGTAILLDSSSRIWFYNVPGCVDPYLEGMIGQAALVALPKTGMTKYTEVKLIEKYDKVDVVVKECD